MNTTHARSLFLGIALAMSLPAAFAAEAIPRAASTPNTPKNWVGPGEGVKIAGQVIVDELMAKHPEIMSITMHGTPPGTKEVYTMFAGSFPDRIGNESSVGDLRSILKGVSQVESKWGTPDYGKKVSIALPLKDTSGEYIAAAMIIAFKKDAGDTRIDTDFLKPGLAIRDGIASRIPDAAALFKPVK
ncbi:hypothetical protein ACQQ2N_04155 [Dokdonella sp. MW10]|uniref:hypothetical protein n=1 Tax=Dokdonella sp. MW10 TaxID=2992926 RepID=UPI003F806DFA